MRACVRTYQTNEGDEPKHDDRRCHSDENDSPDGQALVRRARGWEGSLDVTCGGKRESRGAVLTPER